MRIVEDRQGRERETNTGSISEHHQDRLEAQDLQDPVRRNFADKAGFEALLSERGSRTTTRVILYGDNYGSSAAYAYRT